MCFIILVTKLQHDRVCIDAFICEFDLAEIFEDVSIESTISCHKFGRWDVEKDPSIRFRKIVIGHKCIVKGVVAPGANVGGGALIEKLAVVGEGAKVPARAMVVGNPAFATSTMTGTGNEKNSVLLLGCLKLLWLAFEIYHFFGLILIAQYLWVPHLPRAWRYRPVLLWTLLLIWCSAMSIISSILIK